MLVEMVERRGELRGLARGVEVAIGELAAAPAVEMSRKGVFVALSEPDSFPLGKMCSIAVIARERRFSCRAEVVRKELEPRCGIALRIDSISPEDEAVLLAMLDAL